MPLDTSLIHDLLDQYHRFQLIKDRKTDSQPSSTMPTSSISITFSLLASLCPLLKWMTLHHALNYMKCNAQAILNMIQAGYSIPLNILFALRGVSSSLSSSQSIKPSLSSDTTSLSSPISKSTTTSTPPPTTTPSHSAKTTRLRSYVDFSKR
ncbi:hypothetical protein HMI56_005095 [Coelomomyces lativittatus]|nr:hypothetical protein HMI56_005095 [Coelomomyces lativittatus]